MAEDNDTANGGSIALAATVGAVPYDGHHSDHVPSAARSADTTPAVTPARTTPSIRLSSFRHTPRTVARDDDVCMELFMSSNETAVFTGEYDIEVVKGTATVYGAVLNASSGSHRVYAPSIQALPELVARKASTVVRITTVASSLRKLEKLSPLFRNIWTTDSKGRSSAFLGSTADDPMQRPLSVIQTDAATQKVLTQLAGKAEDSQGAIRVMAVGSKSAGKSTFNRQLCNALLTRPTAKRCLYLDLDPGQPEFGPPGQVSLVEVRTLALGPSFTHQASKSSKAYKLLASHTLAAMSFKDDPDHYLACVHELMAAVTARQKRKGTCPLLVNSCGWVSGLGATVLTDLFDIIQVSDAIVIDGIEPALTETIRAKCRSCFALPRAPRVQSLRSPAELRAMQTLAYFHSQQDVKSSMKWTNKALNTMHPLIVKYDGPAAGITAIASYGQTVPSKFLAEVLDGSIVALVTCENDEALRQALSASLLDGASAQAEAADSEPSGLDLIRRTPEQLPYIPSHRTGYLRPLEPRHSSCAGLALVRGIDTERRELHLVTPMHESQIAEIMRKPLILVRGSFDAPEWAYLEDLYLDDTSAGADERPWAAKKAMVGIEGAVWRLRHPPTAAQLAGR